MTSTYDHLLPFGDFLEFFSDHFALWAFVQGEAMIGLLQEEQAEFFVCEPWRFRSSID
jgi:hypothetical protein